MCWLGGWNFLKLTPCNLLVKGSVQQKLRWVENGVNRSVGASDCGARRSFLVLIRFHLGFAKFPFPVSTAQIIGEFWINRGSSVSDVAPIELALYSCHSQYYWRCMAFGANRRSGGMLAAPIGEVRRIRSANMKFSRIFLYVRCASPNSGVWIVAPIALAQH